jgi:apolipoprotein N-acyltransferase
MDLSVNLFGRTMLVLAAVMLTAGAYWVSFGLHPVWWLVWFAPLPVLLLASRLKAWQALAISLAARALGGLNLWNYMLHDIQIPLGIELASILVPSAFFSLAVLFYRFWLRKSAPWLAMLALPVALVAGEYLFSLWQGTFGNTAYTQLRNLPILQLASLSGLWGISFTVYLFSAGLGAIASTPRKRRARMAVALAAYYAGVLAYGAIRLHTAPVAANSVLVGLVETHAGWNMFPPDAGRTMALMQNYASQMQPLAGRGAQFIVLPEMTALVPDSLLPQVDALFQHTAHALNVQILLGIIHVTDHAGYNEARLYSATGQIETVYRKHHLVPSLEGRSTPGTEISVLPQPVGRIGIEICRDMDYPELARRYGNQQVGLVLVPAWDQGVDDVWHGHMALMRGVEDGFTLVRDAKVGLLTSSDDRGRILAEESTRSDGALVTLLTTVPVRHDFTLYQKWGDWFAWVDLAALAALAAFSWKVQSLPLNAKLDL